MTPTQIDHQLVKAIQVGAVEAIAVALLMASASLIDTADRHTSNASGCTCPKLLADLLGQTPAPLLQASPQHTDDS